MNVTYRLGEEIDAETIAQLNCQLAQETESRSLDWQTVLNGVRNGLRLTPEVQYFVAESEGRVIGQLMLTREWSDWRNGWMIWLQSVYVEADFRRSGIFRSLFQYSINTLRARSGIAGIRLYVERANQTAKACYHSLGFCDAGYDVLEIDLTTDA
ncbi:MAG: GNAT family N-acetyltransferase [Planctomycetota bacterium]